MSEPLRVLFVDDSEMDVVRLLRELKKGGYATEHQRVDDAPSLRQALQTSQWQIVVSDFHMPNFDGLKALQVVKEAQLDIPFILVSAVVSEETAVQAMKQGAHDYIMKGNPARLVPAVQRELREAQARAEQRRTQSALRQRDDQLRQTQKLEAIGRVAAGAAHDFKNVLTIITASSELLLKDTELKDSQRHRLDNIVKAAEQARVVLKQLLAFSRKEEFTPKALNLSETITAMKQMLQSLVGSLIELKLTLNPDVRCIEADPNRIEQVILNLAINARDAMPQGGTLTITTSNLLVSPTNAFQHVGIPPAEYTLLTVTDSGTGMSDETKEHLFEPFFTTKEAGKGTGLGLSTCYGIVQQSNGHIRVNSEIGKGTSFCIYLPAILNNTDAPGATESDEAETIFEMAGK